MASLLGCDPAEVVFTGGASEANNLCIKGMAWARRDAARYGVTSTVEHGSVSRACQFLQTYEGWDIGWTPVDTWAWSIGTSWHPWSVLTPIWSPS